MKSWIILVLVAVAVTASPVKDAELCTDCKAVFGDVKARLTSPEFSGAIVDGVDKYFCNFLLIGKATCKQITQTIVQTAVGFASNAIVPETICAMLQYCSAPVPNQEFQNHLTESLNMANRFISLTKEEADLCVDCKTLFKDVKARLSSDAFAQGVSSQINKYTCDFLLVGKEYCESMVQNVVSNTFKSAAGVIDPVSICTLLTYCQPPTPPTPPQPLFHPDHMDMIDRVFGLVGTDKKVKEDVDLCADCKAVFGDIKTRLVSPTFASAIAGNLEKFTCNLLPVFSTECTMLVNTSVSSILGLMASFVDPPMICTSLAYCSA